MQIIRFLVNVFLILWLLPISAWAANTKLLVDIGYVSRATEASVPLSLLDLPIEDDGLFGAKLGLKDNQTTGRFLSHEYKLHELVIPESETLEAQAQQWLQSGIKLFVVDLNARDLLALSDTFSDAENVLLFNIRAQDNALRNEACRANVLHIAPSRAMLTDALAQYLVWKRWGKIVLVTGRHPEDEAYSLAMQRAAKRYGLKIVDKKNWTAKPGARRTDSGHHSVQAEVPVFTQFKEHDVLVVADEADEFGEYLMFHTTRARLVAGTQGLLPTAWHRSQEQWGATQIQRRFEKLAGRWMSARDYAAWAAIRSIGEAVTKTSSNDASILRAFMVSTEFKLAAFKGVALNFRAWNGQLRQPVLLAGPRMLVSVSPQNGFLHQFSELDTLGYDQPESTCKAF